MTLSRATLQLTRALLAVRRMEGNMVMLKSLIVSCALLILMLAGGFPAQASPEAALVAQANQEQLSTADIERFANAYKAVQDTQLAAEAEMVAAVEAQGMSVEEFNEIAETQQDQTSDNDAAAAEANPQFAAAVEQILAIRQKAETEMVSEIEAEGLEVAQFNQILEQARQDESLQEQIRDQLVD